MLIIGLSILLLTALCTCFILANKIEEVVGRLDELEATIKELQESIV